MNPPHSQQTIPSFSIQIKYLYFIAEIEHENGQELYQKSILKEVQFAK